MPSVMLVDASRSCGNSIGAGWAVPTGKRSVPARRFTDTTGVAEEDVFDGVVFTGFGIS